MAYWPPQLSAASTNINVKVCYPTPDPAPTLTSPTDGTKTEDSSILMSGQATPNVPVYAYRNNVQVGFVTAGGDGAFAISVSLGVGTNELKASTNNDCHTPTYSNVVTVEREVVQPPDPEPEQPGGGQGEEPSESPGEGPAPQAPGGLPPPEEQKRKEAPKKQPPTKAQAPIILQPEDGAIVHEPFVLVVGETSPNTTVHILRNDHIMAEVLSDDRGRFMARIPLEQGKNRLMAAVGTLFSKTVSVTYEPTQPSSGRQWFVRGILVAVGLSFGLLVFTLIWQPMFAKRIWHLLGLRRRWK